MNEPARATSSCISFAAARAGAVLLARYDALRLLSGSSATSVLTRDNEKVEEALHEDDLVS
jgi:hypothetical protein